MRGSINDQIYALVRQIPEGQVATYGQLARLVGCSPRVAGYAMAVAPGNIPWHRVINSQGEVSERSGGDGARRQKALLEKEAVKFNVRGRMRLTQYQWQGPPPDM